MNKDEVAKKFAEQVRRSMDVKRIEGYDFPNKCDVGVLVLSYTPTNYKVKVRMDNLSLEALITKATEAEDIVVAVDHLIEPWLVVNATKKPQEAAQP
jgi:hypothetical protein